MSAFKFIKSHKTLSNSNSNVQVPYDNDPKLKNIDNLNNAPAQPAQSFNIADTKINQPQQKKSFAFIKRKPNNVNNNLEQSNTSVNSNEQKFNDNNNNFITDNDLHSLINNTNELLNFGAVQRNEDNLNNDNKINENININTLGEVGYQNFGNNEEDNSNNFKKETYFNNNLNFLNQDFAANNMANNNYEEKQKEIEKPKEKRSGFSFLNKNNKKNNNNNNIANISESDSNKNIPYIANKTPLSSSMSDKLSDKGGDQNINQGYMNINQAAAETEKDLIENNEYYMDMNSFNNSNSNNNTNTYENNNNNFKKKRETFTPEKKEEIKEKEISELSINSKYKIKKK